MSFSLENNTREEEEEDLDDDLSESYGVRDGTLFIIDTTPPMFEKHSNNEADCFFVQCLKQYEEILKQKLSWSRQDWMGLILFGTERWDMNPETRNILTLQKLDLVSISNLTEIMKITGHKWKDYKEISSSTTYPLHDALWHAAQMFYAVKLTMPLRRIILCTCSDDPLMTDDNEKHRIRVKVTGFTDIGLQLFVIGLGDNWNHERFYKDLEMLSGKIDSDDYQRTSMKDIVSEVKFPARNMARLPLKLGRGVIMDVSIRNLTVKMQYLKPAHMSTATNVPLTTRSYLQVDSVEDDWADWDETEVPATPALPVLETDIKKYQEFGDRKVFFSPDEIESMCVSEEPGITVICAKPIAYHPLYHESAPFFVSCGKSTRKDNQLLFAALLNKCDKRDLMMICSVVMKKRSSPCLYRLIPNATHGGFFLYKIPFEDAVRDIAEPGAAYTYDDANRRPPTDPRSVDLFERIIQKLRISYDPDMFPNPKLQHEMKALEALALDLEDTGKPEDQTLPSEDAIKEKFNPFVDEFNEIFGNQSEDDDGPTPAKKGRRETSVNSAALTDSEYVRDLVKKNELDSCTVVQLKDILKGIGLSTSGKKEDLLRKIKDHYRE